MAPGNFLNAFADGIATQSGWAGFMFDMALMSSGVFAELPVVESIAARIESGAAHFGRTVVSFGGRLVEKISEGRLGGELV